MRCNKILHQCTKMLQTIQCKVSLMLMSYVIWPANDEFGLKNEVADIVVSCDDGTWQQQGFSSLNGVMVVFASHTGKCVDYRVKSKQCASRTSWESWKSTELDLYKQFISKHINHEGSAGAMEVSGLIECFMESEKNRCLRYTSYIIIAYWRWRH